MTVISTRRAIILAAGLGKRMRPITNTIPKPLVKVGGKCLIDHALDFVVSAGITESVVNTHYLAPLLEAHLHTRSTPHITISHEETLLETGGGIVKALPFLGHEAFFSLNSDTICINAPGSHALERMNAFWDEQTMDALLLLHPVADAVGYDGAGDFSLNEQGELVRRMTSDPVPYVFTGIQLLHPRLFVDVPQGAFSLNILYDRLMQQKTTMPRIRGLVHEGKWLHVGDPAAITLAEQYLI